VILWPGLLIQPSSFRVPKRPDLGKASLMLEGFTALLTSSPDLFSARLDAISDVHSSSLPPTLFSLRLEKGPSVPMILLQLL